MKSRIPVIAMLAAALVSCAGSAWRNARREDTVTAYHAFLREYPDSSFTDQARERLELARVRQRPTRDAYEAFREKYGGRESLAELMPHVEDVLYRHARAIGTTEAYRDFLSHYPDGKFTDRARGNLEYLESEGFGGDVLALAAFAAEHPASDYAAEASRSASAVDLRGASGFDRVGLVVDVSATTPGADRLQRVFRDRAVAAYTSAGIGIALLPSIEIARAKGLPAILQIRHDERETSTELERGTVKEPGIVARTEVILRRLDGSGGTIWSDTFEFRAPLSAHRPDSSILFSPGSLSTYWAELDGQFFVPVARWSTEAAAREPVAFPKRVAAVDVSERRAVVLFGDGDFQILDLGDPAELVPLGEYRRKRDLSTFSGVTAEGSRVAIFGPDGIEIVALDGERVRSVSRFGRDSVGSVVDVEWIDNAWLAATNRGLLQLGDDSENVRVLIPRPILGMTGVPGNRLMFSDGTSLFVASVPLLQAGRVESELRLGRGFNPRRVRAYGRTAVVLGARDAIWLDLRTPTPRVRSRIGGTESGRVRDAAVVGDRLFLIGPRGLQVADRSGERIIDSVDVLSRERVGVAGRHLVMVGEASLQVVDATPFIATGAAAGER